MNVTDFVGIQVSTLPAKGGETLRKIDLEASVKRAERHAEELRRATPSPQATYEQEFGEAVTALGLRSFPAPEVIAPHKRVARNGAKNELPPPKLAPRLFVILCVEQLLRDEVGGIRLNSLHRIDAYNRAIGGARKSQHRACTAIDGQPLEASVRNLRNAWNEMKGKLIVLSNEQARVIRNWSRRHGTNPYTGSVFGEPFRPIGYDLDLGTFTCKGGSGTYRTFHHNDLRGIVTTWNG